MNLCLGPVKENVFLMDEVHDFFFLKNDTAHDEFFPHTTAKKEDRTKSLFRFFGERKNEQRRQLTVITREQCQAAQAKAAGYRPVMYVMPPFYSDVVKNLFFALNPSGGGVFRDGVIGLIADSYPPIFQTKPNQRTIPD